MLQTSNLESLEVLPEMKRVEKNKYSEVSGIIKLGHVTLSCKGPIESNATVLHEKFDV